MTRMSKSERKKKGGKPRCMKKKERGNHNKFLTEDSPPPDGRGRHFSPLPKKKENWNWKRGERDVPIQSSLERERERQKSDWLSLRRGRKGVSRKFFTQCSFLLAFVLSLFLFVSISLEDGGS